MRKWTCSTLFALLLPVLMTASPGMAATFRVGDSVSVTSPTGNDIYIAGGKVVVEENIRGDAVIAGGNIIMRGDVQGDLLVAGGNMVFNGAVTDDARVAGGDITFTERVEGDLIVFGGNVTITRQASIGGDMVVAAGQAVLDGTVGGNLKFAGGNLDLNGEVRGNAIIYRSDSLTVNGSVGGTTIFSAGEVTLSDSASFGGDVMYWAGNAPVDFGRVDLSGKATEDPSLKSRMKWPSEPKIRRKAIPGLFGIWFLYTTLAGAIAVLILILLPKKLFSPAVESLRSSPLKNLGVGLLYFLVTPFLILFFIITILGIPVGLFLSFLFMVSILFSKSLSAVLLARWAERKKYRSWTRPTLFLVSVGFLLTIKVAAAIPIAGWIIVTLVVLTCIGALLSGALEGVR